MRYIEHEIELIERDARYAFYTCIGACIVGILLFAYLATYESSLQSCEINHSKATCINIMR